jgi:hypothetical protein
MDRQIYRRGIPTLIDVEKLREYFGVPKIGQTITYKEIEVVISVEFNSYRWHSVIHAWRDKIEREANIIFRAIPGEGLQACSPKARIDLATRHYRGGIKKIVRAGDIAAKTERRELDDEEKKLADFLQVSGAKLSTAMALQPKSPSLENANYLNKR